MDTRTNFFDLNREAMRGYFTRLGEKPYRATQLMKWMYHHGVIDPLRMTDVGKSLRERLAQETRFTLPGISLEQQSRDGTRKWLMGIDAENSVETVFIPEPDRGTLCISSQVGCPLDCSFCSTGKQGFNRNLDTAQIVGQLWLANERLGYFTHGRRIITNVVLMGMGEPLLNFDNVVTATQIMTDDIGFGLANKRVTLSTAGVVPGIERLAEVSRVSLAVSLHAPVDELRDELVPINRRYRIAELMRACAHYADRTGGEPITFEYVMLAGVNDGDSEARALAKLLKPLPAKVNLIPFNPFPGAAYVRSPQAVIDRFRDILREHGLITVTRRTRGEDIDAACGQLTGRVMAKANRVRNARLENRV